MKPARNPLAASIAAVLAAHIALAPLARSQEAALPSAPNYAGDDANTLVFKTLSALTPNTSPEGLHLDPKSELTREEQATAHNEKQVSRISTILFHKPAEAAAESMRTTVLIMVLTGVALVQNELHEARLRGETPSPARVAKLSGMAAAHILDSGDVWFGMAGSGTAGFSSKIAGALAGKPVRLIRALLSKPESRAMFGTLLKSGIQSSIAFSGWELGGQLLGEARMLIENEEDFKRAEHLTKMTFGALSEMAGNPSFEAREDRRVFGLVLQNMARILFLDDDLRRTCFYNAWRLRVAKGDFVALVTGMVGAGAIGTAIFPGAGTLAGMGFGIVGGIASMTTSNVTKDSITVLLKSGRYLYNRTRLGLNDADSEESLRERARYREGIVDVHVEGIFQSRLRINELTQSMAITRQALARTEKYKDAFEGLYESFAYYGTWFGRALFGGWTSPLEAAAGGLSIDSLRVQLEDQEDALKSYRAAESTLIPSLDRFYLEDKKAIDPKFVHEHEKLDALASYLHEMLEAFQAKDTPPLLLLGAKQLQKLHYKGFREKHVSRQWLRALRAVQPPNYK